MRERGDTLVVLSLYAPQVLELVLELGEQAEHLIGRGTRARLPFGSPTALRGGVEAFFVVVRMGHAIASSGLYGERPAAA